MRGIISDEFEVMLKKNTSILIALSDSLTEVKKSCSFLTTSFNGADLSFITDKLNSQLNQFDNISKKTDSYQSVLKSVYSGYFEQNSQIVRDIKNLIS